MNRKLLIGLTSTCVALSGACSLPTDLRSTVSDKSVVLLVTPKMIADFAAPEGSVQQFFRHYSQLTSGAAEVIVIFAVGNSDHILTYRGKGFWGDSVEWARTTNFVPMSDRRLTYAQVMNIARVFKDVGKSAGIITKVFEHIDSGSEFTVNNDFKYVVHPECTSNAWGSFDIRGRLQADIAIFASAPKGISEGTTCGTFLANQVAVYVKDLGFDGIMFDNQLGTRGRWLPDNGPGYSDVEAAAIREFMRYSRRLLGARELMWFDSYNPLPVERDVFSFPRDAYASFDYVIAAGFCVIETSKRYRDNLISKTDIRNPARLLAVLDYVDPWYSYRSITEFPVCSERLERIAIEERQRIDGIMLFANDANGAFVPQDRLDAFAAKFFAKQ